MRKYAIKKDGKYWSRFGGLTDDIYKAQLWPSENVDLEPGEKLVPVEVEIKEVKDESI